MDAPNRVLIIDDDPSMQSVLPSVLESHSFNLAFCRTGQDGQRRLRRAVPDVLLLDAQLPDAHGPTLLASIAEEFPGLPILVLLPGGGSQDAIEAIKLGAYECIRRPLELGLLRQRIEEAIRLSRSRATPAANADLPDLSDATLLVGETGAIQQVFNSIGRVARYDGPVLIQGETGTGKETVARTIHQHSARSDGQFDILHCPAVSTDRFELELSAAEDGPPSTFQRCRGGTLVLQEIGQLSIGSQTRLLQWVRSQGGGWTTNVAGACRLVGCSTEDLEAKVRAGAFRADLYYQLAGEVIQIPPLRERRRDIPLIVAHMMSLLRQSGQFSPGVSFHVTEEAMEILVSYDWPGNLDELYSVLRRCLVEGQGNVVVCQTLLKATERRTPDGTAASTEQRDWASVTDWQAFFEAQLLATSEDIYANAIAEAEAKLLPLVLRHTNGNQSQAARLLGITRASLRKKYKACLGSKSRGPVPARSAG